MGSGDAEETTQEGEANKTSERKDVGNQKLRGDKTKKYDFPAKLRRIVSCNQTMEEYLKQRRLQGLQAQSENLLKHLCGIRSKLNVDDHIKKSLGRGQLNLDSDMRYDDSGEVKDDKEDAESYTTEYFRDHGDNIEKRHMRRIKSKLGMFLNVHWYYSQNIPYIVPRCTAEQYFPIYVRNLINALEKFETTLPILLYYLASYMRPACLPTLIPPQGADIVDPTIVPKKRKKHGLESQNKSTKKMAENSKRNTGKPAKAHQGKVVVKKFRIGDLKPEIKEWKRTSNKLNKVTHRKCIVKPVRIKPFYATVALGKKGPDFGALADENLDLFNYDSEGSFDADFGPKQDRKDTWSEECDDEEVINEDQIPKKKMIPRTNGLIKAIFAECLDEMVQRKEKKVADVSTPSIVEKVAVVEETQPVEEAPPQTDQAELVPEVEL